MATEKVIDMSTRAASNLNYDEYLYLTNEAPNTDERLPTAYLRDYILDGITGGVGIDVTKTGSPASTNPVLDLTLDVSELTAAGGTADVTDYVVIEAASDSSTKKILVGSLPFVTAAVSDVASLSSNLTASPTTGDVKIDLATTLTGLTSVTSTDFVGDLTGDVTGDVTGDLTGDVTGDVTGDLTGTASVATALAATLGVTGGGTGIATIAKGSVLVANAADTLSVASGVTNGHVLTYDSAADTVGWAAPGHITNIEGTAILSTSETGTAKFLRVDGDNSCSWQVPPDTDTTYTAGPGIDLTGTKFSVEVTSNGGLEFSGAGDSGTLQIAQGISQYDVAQFTTGVVDDDFLRVDGTVVEGRSASEVKSDIGLGNVENTALSTWAGTTNITTLGTIASGTWEGTTVAVDQGGTGQTSYTNGQLLIGNTTGNTLAKATLTAGSNITITEGAGSITIAATSGGDPAGTAVAMAIALGG